MKMVKHHNIVKLYEVLASRTKVRVCQLARRSELWAAHPPCGPQDAVHAR